MTFFRPNWPTLSRTLGLTACILSLALLLCAYQTGWFNSELSVGFLLTLLIILGFVAIIASSLAGAILAIASLLRSAEHRRIALFGLVLNLFTGLSMAFIAWELSRQHRL